MLAGYEPLTADLSGYTEEEIALAKKLHDETCNPTNGCEYGAFVSYFDPYAWLDMARDEINKRPQKEVLFNV